MAVSALTQSSGLVQCRTNILTNAQLLAVRATPIEIVEAPGAGKRNLFLGASLRLNVTTTAYTESTANIGFKYKDGSGVQVNETVEATGFVDQTGITHTNARPKLDAICTDAQCVNLAIVMHNLGAGEWTGGNAANTMTVTVYFVTVESGTA